MPPAAAFEDDEGEEDRRFCKDASHRVKCGRRAEIGGRKAWHRGMVASASSAGRRVGRMLLVCLVDVEDPLLCS